MKRVASWCGVCGLALAIGLVARGQTPPAQNPPSAPANGPKATDTKPMAKEPIDFARARELLRKKQNGEKLTPEEAAYLQRAIDARRGKEGKTAEGGREQTGFKPLCDMSADDRYQGQDGGLYGGGKNSPPEAHRRAAEAELARIQPLGPDGQPSPDGRVVLISISMSNATQEFSTFKRIADADGAKSPKLTIIDWAQGGQAMAEWASPKAQPWTVAERLIANARCTPQQVQVAWIKLANKGPRGSLEEHGRKLQRDTLAVIQIAKQRFPNLRIAYLASRIYGGYSTGSLNPEPYAYESAFVVRWLIQDQIQGDAELSYTAEKGAAKAPLLLWGPYLWADGTKPRGTDKEAGRPGGRRHPPLPVWPRKSRRALARLLQNRSPGKVLVHQVIFPRLPSIAPSAGSRGRSSARGGWIVSYHWPPTDLAAC